MGSKVEDVNLQLPSNLLMWTYWCETSDTTLGSWIINMIFSRQLNLMSAYIVKMIDLLDSFQWSHLCPPVSQLRLKLLFKQRPSPVRCGWNTWQKIQGRRHLERYKGYSIYMMMQVYIRLQTHHYYIHNGIWNITVEIISDSTRISICNWLLGYLPTGAPHQTPVGCVAEIFGAQNGTQNGGNQEKKKPSSHAVWPYEHQNSK